MTMLCFRARGGLPLRYVRGLRPLTAIPLDAARILEAGVASAEDIDTAMKLGCGMLMGPFELMDHTCVEISRYVGEILFNYTKEARFAPPGLVRNMVKAGHLGKKTGKGFYDYPAKLAAPQYELRAAGVPPQQEEREPPARHQGYHRDHGAGDARPARDDPPERGEGEAGRRPAAEGVKAEDTPSLRGENRECPP